MNMYKDKKTGLLLPDSARPQVSGYSEAGASRIRRALRGFTPRSTAPSEDIDQNNYTLRQRGRMLYMSSPVATSAINTNRTKVVGVGLTLKSSIDHEALGLTAEQAKAWQKHTEKEFALWANNKASCDATGMNDFTSLQQLALISWLMSGDVFALFQRRDGNRLRPYSLRIHLIEADRVRTPGSMGAGLVPLTEGKNPQSGNRIFDGVEVDASGMVTAYYVHNTYPWQRTVEPEKYQRIEAYGERTGLPNILHIMNSERCDQYRGVTYLAQVIEPLLQLNRYERSALTAAMIQCFFTAWVTTEAGASDLPFNEVGAGNIAGIPTENPSGISSSPNELEMGEGTINILQPGEKVTFGNPTMPVTGFDSFVKTFCELIGAGLGIPYDVLIKEYNSSYSSARAALLDAWEDFRMRRAWFVSDFCQPVYEMWLSEAVALGRVKAPGFFSDPLLRAAWCSARWIGPVQGSLDPLKEAKAAVLLIQNGLKTHGQVAREMGGGDWDENVEVLADENRRLEAAGGSSRQEIDLHEKEEDEGNA